MEKFVRNDLFDLTNNGEDAQKMYGKKYFKTQYKFSRPSEKDKSRTVTGINDVCTQDYGSPSSLKNQYCITMNITRFRQTKKCDHYYLSLMIDEANGMAITTKNYQFLAPATQDIVDDDDTYELGEYVRKICSWERVSAIVKKFCEENVDFSNSYIKIISDPEELITEEMIRTLSNSISVSHKIVYEGKLYKK